MYINLDVAIQFLYVLIALNVIFAIVIYSMKINNMRKVKIASRFEGKLKDYLTYVQVNIDGKEPLQAPPFSMNRVEREVMQERLNDMIESFTGAPREQWMELSRKLGFVQLHLERLNKGSYSVKIDAAYHLGCMRVQEAVPALFKLLRNHKLNSSLFIVARSIAKCARDVQDIKDMVQVLLQHNKGFYDLLVDMIKEANIDHGALFAEYIQMNNDDFVHIGLTGLKEYTEPTVASAVYRLIDSSDAAIQHKAVEIYLKSVHFIPRNVVQKLLQHPMDQVRVLTVQAIAHLKLDTYIDKLKTALLDQSKLVSNASAKGLLLLGEEGITALCGTAAEVRGAERGENLQTLIEDEIQSLSHQLHDLQKLTRYNALVYAYEKTFGKNKRIYRVV